MASSQYRVKNVSLRLAGDFSNSPVIRYNSPVSSVIEEHDRKIVVINDRNPMNIHADLMSKMDLSRSSPTNAIVFSGGNHSCRETMIGEIFAAKETMDFFEKREVHFTQASSQRYGNMCSFIEYYQQDGYSLSPERIELIMEFYQRFLTQESSSPFYVQEYDKNIYLSFKHTVISRVYAASLLLWCFRNVDIMSDCLKKFPRKTHIGQLFEYLSHAFLKNEDWGDGENPTGLLSLFAYGFLQPRAIDHSERTNFNGPATFATRGFSAQI